MFTANQDYLKLPGSYLFSTVAKKTRAFTDAHPDAAGGFAAEPDKTLAVVFPQDLLRQLPEKQHEAIIEILAQDPRPSYRPDGDREYGLFFAGSNIRFRVENGVLKVISVQKIPEGKK